MTPATPARRPGFLAALLLLTAALGLAACQSTKFDPKAGAHVKSVALQGPGEPPYYIVTIYDANVAAPATGPYPASPGPYYPSAGPVTNIALGAVNYTANSIIRMAADSDIDPELTVKMVDGAQLRLGADLHDQIAAALGGAGYQVTRDPALAAAATATGAATAATTSTTAASTSSTSAAATSATGTGAPDAVLKIQFVYAGYVDQFFAPYEPLVWVSVALTDSRSGKDLFRQRYNYSTHTGNLDDVRFDPDGKYDFKNEEALLANPALAAEGLKAAIPLIAADVAAKLKRPGV